MNQTGRSIPEQTCSILSPLFGEALVYASQLHRTQLRKETSIPYIAHLLAVTAIVLEYDGTEDEAIATLLHDAVEDQGGQPTLKVIRVLMLSSNSIRDHYPVNWSEQSSH